MIASLTSIKTIKQRRPRQSEEAAKLHNHAYAYRIKVERDGTAVTVPVCFPTLLSVFDITKSIVEKIRTSLSKLVSYKINCAKLTLYPLPLAQFRLDLKSEGAHGNP